MPLITTNIDLVLRDLHAGKPVAIPTETVYGLAAPIDNEEAIKAVFAMKNRPLNHPLIVHVAPDWNLHTLINNLPDYAAVLIKKFWPGPLTLVLPCKPGAILPLVNGGQTTIALRCPAHPVTQELLHLLGTPLVAPSANPFGKISPTTAAHVEESFPHEDLTILDGGRCTVGIESTIVDATDPYHYQILRHGLLSEDLIRAELGQAPENLAHEIRVPGKLDSHYQPTKTLFYFEDFTTLEQFCRSGKNDEVYVIASRQPEGINDLHFHPLAENPEKAAFDLYFQLRRGDASNAKYIVIELPPLQDSWQGIRERILKAGVPYFEIGDAGLSLP